MLSAKNNNAFIKNFKYHAYQISTERVRKK